jgi:hypothetical protein
MLSLNIFQNQFSCMEFPLILLSVQTPNCIFRLSGSCHKVTIVESVIIMLKIFICLKNCFYLCDKEYENDSFH